MSVHVPAELATRGPGPSAPPRRRGSIRRTSTIDATFPDGLGGETILEGRARDLLTRDDGTITVTAEAVLHARLDEKRRILQIESSPELPRLTELVGESAMGGHRRRLAGLTTADGSPLHLLLDDLPGATLVSQAAFQSWLGLDEYLNAKLDVRQRIMRDVCSGYQDGSEALHPDGTLRWDNQRREPARPLDDVGDPEAWHELRNPTGIAMRRARRTDVWNATEIDAFFQDSSTLPTGGRQAIHEYQLTAEATNGVLRSVHPIARVLPYLECPLAVPRTGDLIGRELAELRTTVLRDLAGAAGCTHLNDMLRSLADVPVLQRTLDS
ncbi:DUF2889 domain-containing protein [Cryptosporangium sp. NPDC048952]|uniref:DUF2889 domain-containing protein n=1 Tax=Cryptosporangium sp. NPDC048952 TaxID=3363961 RepID=UPI003716AD75